MTKALTIAFAAAYVFLLAIEPAAAISRYNTTGMSCGRIHSILDSQRVAILRYPSSRNRSLTLYDRYVRDERQCDPHQVAESVTIPSANGQCPVLHCIEAPDICDDIFSPLCRD